MISLADFLSLRSGDLVVWRGKYLRTIQKGPADERQPHKTRGGQIVVGCVGVEFAIRKRTWRNRPTTTYNFTDVRDKLTYTGKRTGQLVLESERLTLAEHRFGPESFRAELADEEARAARMASCGKQLCRAYPRLKRLVEKEPAE